MRHIASKEQRIQHTVMFNINGYSQQICVLRHDTGSQLNHMYCDMLCVIPKFYNNVLFLGTIDQICIALSYSSVDRFTGDATPMACNGMLQAQAMDITNLPAITEMHGNRKEICIAHID